MSSIGQISDKPGASDMLLVLCVVAILLILFVPIPAGLLDFLLVTNFSTALLILLVTFYTDKPIAFSTFPSLLLIATLFRLSLNIAATRLILADADAGKVIGAVGEHVVGGNYVIGLVVFLILIVVQYVVVTNGAQRVAEVAARFTLDSLPGKQMSVDADLNMGIIDQDEAKLRRSELEREASFYGAMDGASKFVKGDAVAGIIIVIIDIVGGLSIGLAQHNMSWGDALHRYTLLTVGDGIVTQIPSLIIAVATGIIITRAAADGRLAKEIANQFLSHPKTLVIVAVALLVIMFLPGIPLLPVAIVLFGMCLLAWVAYRFSAKQRADGAEGEPQKDADVAEKDDASLEEILKIRPFELIVGTDLSVAYFSVASDFKTRVGYLRKQLADQLGVLLPSIAYKSEKDFKGNEYRIKISGVVVGEGLIEPSKLLAINPGGVKVRLEGIRTKEPTYGLDAIWIESDHRGQAHAAGYTLVEPDTVLLTHMQEISKKNAANFISRSEAERLVVLRRDQLGSLIDELIPSILTYSDIQMVLKGLVDEGVSIKNIDIVLEVLVDAGRTIKGADQLVEMVRERLGLTICSSLADGEGQLNVLTLSAELEARMLGSVGAENAIKLHPSEMDQLFTKIARASEVMLKDNKTPVLLVAGGVRRALRGLLCRAVPHVKVLSVNEVSSHSNVSSSGVISINVRAA